MANTIIATINGVNFYYMGKCAEFKDCHILSYNPANKIAISGYHQTAANGRKSAREFIISIFKNHLGRFICHFCRDCLGVLGGSIPSAVFAVIGEKYNTERGAIYERKHHKRIFERYKKQRANSNILRRF